MIFFFSVINKKSTKLVYAKDLSMNAEIFGID